MKKVITISLLLIFVLSGCAGKKNVSNEKQREENDQSRRFRMPDFEKPEEAPSISGLVKSIIGNEVTILKIERPDREGMGDMSEEEKTEKKVNFNPSSAMGGGGGMKMGGMRRVPEGSSEESMIEIMKQFSSGEEVVLIPIGVKMLKKENNKMVEATLKDLEPDSMLMVWTEKTITDRNIANFVLIN